MNYNNNKQPSKSLTTMTNLGASKIKNIYGTNLKKNIIGNPNTVVYQFLIININSKYVFILNYLILCGSGICARVQTQLSLMIFAYTFIHNVYLIKYAHKRTMEGHERYRRKIHFLIPEVKANSFMHDSV